MVHPGAPEPSAVDAGPHSPAPSWDEPFQPPYWPAYSLATGQVWRVKAPFFKTVASDFGGEEFSNWVPGCGRTEDGERIIDAEGFEVRQIVSLHRPAPFPTRVFYQRWWVLNGRRFGRKTCRVATQGMFRQWLNNTRGPYRWQARGELVGDGGEAVHDKPNDQSILNQETGAPMTATLARLRPEEPTLAERIA